MGWAHLEHEVEAVAHATDGSLVGEYDLRGAPIGDRDAREDEPDHRGVDQDEEHRLKIDANEHPDTCRVLEKGSVIGPGGGEEQEGRLIRSQRPSVGRRRPRRVGPAAYGRPYPIVVRVSREKANAW